MQNYKRGLSFCLLALFSAGWGDALAAGEVYKRIVDHTSINACADKLVEWLHEGGNVHGFFSVYVLACLSAPKEASWVLLSGVSCDDTTSEGKCKINRIRNIPRFVVQKDFWNDTTGLLTFNLLKYGLGSKCHVVTQQYESASKIAATEESTVQEAWLCEKLQIYDSTQNFDEPFGKTKSFKAVKLQTSGKYTLKAFFPEEPFASERNDSYDPVSRFIVPEEYYRFKVE